jgi:hypothetical protein
VVRDLCHVASKKKFGGPCRPRVPVDERRHAFAVGHPGRSSVDAPGATAVPARSALAARDRPEILACRGSTAPDRPADQGSRARAPARGRPSGVLAPGIGPDGRPTDLDRRPPRRGFRQTDLREASTRTGQRLTRLCAAATRPIGRPFGRVDGRRGAIVSPGRSRPGALVIVNDAVGAAGLEG